MAAWKCNSCWARHSFSLVTWGERRSGRSRGLAEPRGLPGRGRGRATPRYPVRAEGREHVAIGGAVAIGAASGVAQLAQESAQGAQRGSQRRHLPTRARARRPIEPIEANRPRPRALAVRALERRANDRLLLLSAARPRHCNRRWLSAGGRAVRPVRAHCTPRRRPVVTERGALGALREARHTAGNRDGPRARPREFLGSAV